MNDQKAVDEILLGFLRSLGCDLDEVNEVKDLTPAILFAGAVRCVRQIDSSKVFNSKLPQNKGAAIQICGELANAITDVGYRGEVSFHHFLFPTEMSTRNLFVWLSQNVRQEDAMEGDAAPQRADQVLMSSITNRLTQLSKATWMPPFLTPARASRRDHATTTPFEAVPLTSAWIPPPRSSRHKAQESFIRSHLPYVTQQPKAAHQVAPSLLRFNTSAWTQDQEQENLLNAAMQAGLSEAHFRKRKLDRINNLMSTALRSALTNADLEREHFADGAHVGSRVQGMGRFARQVEMMDKDDGKKVETEEEVAARRAEELSQLDARVSGVQDMLAQLRQQMEAFLARRRQVEAEIQAEAQKTLALKEEYDVKNAVLGLLDDAPGNILKLRQLSQQNANKLMQLATEWEAHRVPLVEAYRALRDQFSDRRDAAKAKLEEIREMRDAMKQVAEDIQKRDARYKQLVEIVQRLGSDKTRSMYTDRILEIVRNVKKQKLDIDKILLETRDLKKEISQITDTLNRSFAVTDELIFADAKKDETAKQAYRQLVSMNQKFEELTDAVRETGEVRNAILHLEARVDSLKARTAGLDLDRVRADLEELRQENQRFMLQLTGAPQ